MWKIKLTVLIFCISLNYTYQHKITDAEITDTPHTFDVLVFGQQWPVSVCKYWLNHLNGKNCIFPKKTNQWSVHGIWPTVYCDTYENCSKSWPFDPKQIESIESDVEQTWVPVYNEPNYTFWRDAWNKYGTCAAKLKPFNSEFKYFSKGVEWNHKYSISDMLADANIFPDDTKQWNPEKFVDAVKAKTNKTARLRCYRIKDVLYVKELSICFDKQLNLINCQLPEVEELCRCSKSVLYPKKV